LPGCIWGGAFAVVGDSGIVLACTRVVEDEDNLDPGPILAIPVPGLSLLENPPALLPKLEFLRLVAGGPAGKMFMLDGVTTSESLE
jgi:hypothetical protein